MKIRIFWAIVFATLRMNLFAGNTPLDAPVSLADREAVYQCMKSMRGALSQRESFDFEAAIQRLIYHCNAAVRIGLSEQEADTLFLDLVNGHTPRQIILIAAALALAESAPITDPHRLIVGDAPEQYAQHLKSEGVGFIKTYGLTKPLQEKK